MGLNNAGNFRAGGTIAPAVFVKLDTTADHQVVQAGASDAPIGISQVAMKRAPGLAGSDPAVAAATNDPIQVWGIGDVCPLTYKGTVTRGDFIKPTTGGGITASSTDVCGAIALESGVTGSQGLVQILPPGTKMP